MHCDKQRRADDHLSYVAGMQNRHVDELQEQGVSTLEGFAKRPEALDHRPQKGSRDTYTRLHKQAQKQYEGRTTGQLVYDLKQYETTTEGLQRLPAPSKGDVFFDLESDRFYENGGIEYLFGIAYEENGQTQYKSWWALDRKSEKRAFEEVMQFFMERWKAFPDFNIYHFAPYEPAAMKRLMQRYGVYMDELDRLLRAERFIDLYAITKESIVASVESYGLKDLEPLIKFEREMPLDKVRPALRFVERALELYGVENIDDDIKHIVEEYNKEDCLGTLALRNWVEDRRKDFIGQYGHIDRPLLKDGTTSENQKKRLEKFAILFDALIKGLPEDKTDFTRIL